MSGKVRASTYFGGLRVNQESRSENTSESAEPLKKPTVQNCQNLQFQ